MLRHELYGKPVDAWSCGVLLSVLLGGSLPFYGTRETLYSQILNGQYKVGCTHHQYEWLHVSHSITKTIALHITIVIVYRPKIFTYASAFYFLLFYISSNQTGLCIFQYDSSQLMASSAVYQSIHMRHHINALFFIAISVVFSLFELVRLTTRI